MSGQTRVKDIKAIVHLEMLKPPGEQTIYFLHFMTTHAMYMWVVRFQYDYVITNKNENNGMKMRGVRSKCEVVGEICIGMYNEYYIERVWWNLTKNDILYKNNT